ncbi:MAG: CBS domain-containing protein [Burkholderiaceae bacterium]|jgi:CBS domain-containing protein|nr:CBS domain-containing protein [Burkholderiaceae bacterium]
MYDHPLREVMDKRKLLKCAPSTTVIEAARQMVAKGIGAVLVIDADHLVGIFTERDAVYRVIARGLPPETTRLSEVMTAAPLTLSPDARFGTALALMHKHGFRHVPVVDKGAPIGMVMARQALDPDMEDFVVEARRREHFDPA